MKFDLFYFIVDSFGWIVRFILFGMCFVQLWIKDVLEDVL